jgi:hypothetical protein
MIVRRFPVASYLYRLRSAPIEQYKTSYVWSQDGWMHDVTKKVRRQYFPILGCSTVMEMIEEPSELTVIPAAQHSESLSILVYSVSPRVWIEKGERYEEVFVEQPGYVYHNTEREDFPQLPR